MLDVWEKQREGLWCEVTLGSKEEGGAGVAAVEGWRAGWPRSPSGLSPAHCEDVGCSLAELGASRGR